MSSFANIKVLIVEDDDSIRRVLKRFFEAYDIVIEECWTVGDALDKLAEAQYDLVMLDYNLMSESKIGWRIAEKVRTDPDKYGTPKIIGMSGTINPEKAIGWLGIPRDYFNMFLTKPFDLSELESQIEDLFKS